MSIGIYTVRHPGMDCRDPVAMDGNAKSNHMRLLRHIGQKASHIRGYAEDARCLSTQKAVSHPCVLDSGNPCRNDGNAICADTHANEIELL